MDRTSAPSLPGEGLRLRKQRETREAIHRAAVRQALVKGPEAATVAEISADANVSPRTFFNYFPTKEDAMLGFSGDLPADEELEGFSSRDDVGAGLVDEVVSLLWDSFSLSPSAEHMHETRLLLGTHPQLMQRHQSRVFAMEQRIASAVATRMRNSASFADSADFEASARMLVMLCTNVVRHALRQCAQAATHVQGETPGDGQPDGPHRPSALEFERALETSLNTLREVMDKLR